MSAEYCAKHYCTAHHLNEFSISSAGTIATPEPIDPTTLATLHTFDIDPTDHIQRQITAEIVHAADIVVAMASYHQELLKEEFGIHAPLFNKICYNTETSVLDLGDVMDDPNTNIPKRQAHLQKTVTYINDAMPAFFAHIGAYQENNNTANNEEKR